MQKPAPEPNGSGAHALAHRGWVKVVRTPSPPWVMLVRKPLPGWVMVVGNDTALAPGPDSRLELEDGRGARLRVELRGAARTDIESLARVLWSAAR